MSRLLRILVSIICVLLISGIGSSVLAGDSVSNNDDQAGSVSSLVKININTASLDELCKLDRIGPKYAQRIIDHREQNGLFRSPLDIMKVKGIGRKTYESNKDIIDVSIAEEDEEE